MDELLAFKSYFDPLFAAYLERKVLALPQTPYFAELGRHLLRLGAEGKRLRPFVALLGYEEDGPRDRSRVLSLMYALETFHLFALIHDDIIDAADERRGVPCVHAAFDRSQAILAGDMCLAWAHEAMDAYRDMAGVAGIFADLAQETIAGQMLDVAMAGAHPVTAELLGVVVELKTARYTFTYPVMLGRLLAGKSDHAREYARFGHHLGEAFQRLDDLGDVLWSAERLGKAPGADVRQGVPTHLSFRIFSGGAETEKAQLQQWWGQGGAVDVPALQELFRSSGAVEGEVQSVTVALQEAREVLAGLPLGGNARRSWESCLDLLTEKLDTFA